MFLKNIIELCVRGENPERFLNMCSFHNIKIFDIQKREEAYYLKIRAEDFFLLKNIVRKTNVKIKIIQKKGIYFHFKKQAERKIFFVSSFFCLLLLWIGSHFLWGIQISGNSSVTNDLIIDFLQQKGIHYGMPLAEIPIHELKNDLRSTYDEITWVSIYLKGTNLQISLKENDTIKPDNNNSEITSDLIADQNGIIDSILVRQGTAMVKVGDEVSQGDIVISGQIEIPAEDGTIKEIQYCKADGDVYLIYKQPVCEQISFEYLTKEYTGRTLERNEIFVNHKKISIPFFKIPYIKYDSVSENMEFPIIKLFSIPLEIKKTKYQEYRIVKKKYTNSEAEKLLKENLDKIILSLEEKGVQIIEKNVKINTDSVYLSMTGNLILRKKIHVK